MSKQAILLLVLFFSIKNIYAQTQKTSVAIMPFVSASPDYRNRTSQLQEMVIEILSKKSDILLIDRSKDTLLLHELDNQIRETSMDATNLVQQGKVLGAQNMVIGTLSNVSVDKDTKILPGQTHATTTYEANISFSLQLVDVESGRIINQKSFNSSDKSGFLGIRLNIPANTSEDAMADAMATKKKQILAWINQCYPPAIKIIKIDERDKKGFPQTILITGVDASLATGTRLTLNEIEMIDAGDGKQLKRSKSIATLKITDKQDEITVCKIMDGEKEIEGKMTSGAKLEVTIK